VENVKDGESLWIACKLNAAQCNINLQEYPAAIRKATEALKKDEKNVKALYRRGLSRNHVGLAEEALKDLSVALEVDPGNQAVAVEIARSKKLIAEAKQKEKSAYKNLFSKVSVYDDTFVHEQHT
jgi:tetratricopeptide (TPR) repeat protein